MNKNYKHSLIALIIGAAIIFLLPAKNGLTPAGVRMLGVFIPTIYLWLTCNPGWSSLISISMIAVLNIIDGTATFTGIIGDYAHCVDRMGYGVYYSCANPPHLFGAYSEYLYLPPRAMIHKIDESVPLEAAVLTTSVLGNNVRWMREVGGVTVGDTVVIAGAGQQGLAGTIVAKEAGADKIIVMGTSSSRSKKRLELAKEFGATHTVCIDKDDPVEFIKDITNGAMADVYMDVSGKPHNVEIASDLLRFHGRFVLPGLYGQHFPALDLDKIVQKEIQMFGVLAQSYQANEAAVKIIESRKYPIEKMVTHWFELEDAEKAVLLTGGEIKDEIDPIKCVICPNGVPEGRKATK